MKQYQQKQQQQQQQASGTAGQEKRTSSSSILKNKANGHPLHQTKQAIAGTSSGMLPGHSASRQQLSKAKLQPNMQSQGALIRRNTTKEAHENQILYNQKNFNHVMRLKGADAAPHTQSKVQPGMIYVLTPNERILGGAGQPAASTEAESLKCAVNMLYQEHQMAVNKMKRPMDRGRNTLNLNGDKAVAGNNTHNTTTGNKTKSLLLEGGGGSATQSTIYNNANYNNISQSQTNIGSAPMNESALLGQQPSGLYTNTVGNNERIQSFAINERPKTGMATSGGGMNNKKLISSSQYIHAGKKQHINPYSKTNPTKLKPGQVAGASGSLKSTQKNFQNLQFGVQNIHFAKVEGTDRVAYPMAAQSLRKAVPQIKSGQESFRQMLDNDASSKSLGTAGRMEQDAASSQKTQKKKSYVYCIDTNQIMNMIDYSIHLMGVSMKEIERQAQQYQSQQAMSDFASEFQASQFRSKSNSQISSTVYQKGEDKTNTYADNKSAQDSMVDNRKSKAQSNDNMLNSKASSNQLQFNKPTPEQILRNKYERIELFCGGNQEVKLLTYYINSKLEGQHSNQKFKQRQKKNNSIFKTSDGLSNQTEDMRNKSVQSPIDFARIFGFDEESQIVHQAYQNRMGSGSDISLSDNNSQGGRHFRNGNIKFTYFVENEKILSNKMFFVDYQRKAFVKTLIKLKKHLQGFIQKRYENCITKLGFSTDNEIYNIFSQILSEEKGFFNQISVRKILNQFWLSIKDVYTNIRVRKYLQSFGGTAQNPLIFNPSQLGAMNLNEIEVSDLSVLEEMILKNNFYIRLEIIARGRYLYEQTPLDFQQQSSINFGSQSNLSLSTSHIKRQPQQLRLNSNQFPIHQAIFMCNLSLVSKLLKQEVPGIFYSEKNQLDPCGNTPLLLAVKLGNIDAVKILTDMYTCPKLRPLQELMNAREVATAMKHQQILKILIQANNKIKQQFFEQNKRAIFEVLENIPDFKVDLNLTCDSNWFPVFSSVAPSDTYKIYKQGSNLRLDMSLLGLQKFNLIKGNISVVYKGRGAQENEGELLIINKKLQTVQNIFSRNQEAKENNQIQEIMAGKQVLKKFQTNTVTSEMEKNKNGEAISKKINDFESRKFIIKSRYSMIKYQMNLAQIDQIKGVKCFDDYIECQRIDFQQLIEISINENNCEQNMNGKDDKNPMGKFFKSKFLVGREQGQALTSRHNFGGTHKMENGGGGLSSRENSKLTNLADFNNQNPIYTLEDYSNHNENKHNDSMGPPATLDRSVLTSNKQIIIKKKSQKQIQAQIWLSKSYPFNIEQFMPLIHVLSFCSKQIRQFNKFLIKYPLPEQHSCFPVEARIPLFMTMEAVFSFKNIDLSFNDKSVFEIDKEVSIKQNQNMALYAKQQISYLNMHSSLDTQEDKQTKALKEIYKLCKTDEGDQSSDYILMADAGQDLYKVMEEKMQGQDRNGEQDGYESENSEKIKELFNKMLTKEEEQYDIRNDPLYIEENDNDQEDLLQLSKKEKSLSIKESRRNSFANKISFAKHDPKQMSNINDEQPIALSRNFATGGTSFHDIKNTMSHSDLLKMRKSGNTNGKTSSKQFSMQSDITESAEVSERSFNDKLAKLQIHSFHNVKFMSQFKKNMIAHGLPGNMTDHEIQMANQIVNQRNMQMSHLEQFNHQQIIRQKMMESGNGAEEEINLQGMQQNNLAAIGRAFSLQRGAISGPAGPISNMGQHQHHSNNMSNLSHNSVLSSLNNHGENITDSKLNEERPMIHKSLGKQQIYKQQQPYVNQAVNSTANMGMEVENMTLSPQPPISDDTLEQMQIEQAKSKNPQIMSQKPMMRAARNNMQMGKVGRGAIHNSNVQDGFCSSNHGTLNQSQVTIGSVSTVFKEFQPSLPLAQQIVRQKNLINFINPDAQPPLGGHSSGPSQCESMNEDGISFGSGIMQSMSSIAAGQGGSANISAHMTQNQLMNNNLFLHNSNKVQNRMNNNNNVPSSSASNTADTSINKIGIGSCGSAMSMAGYDSQTSAIYQKQRNLLMSSKQQQILDKNRRKLFLQNLRNDKSDKNKNNNHIRQGGGYLNTIESEGNLPTQQFNSNQIIGTRGNRDNDLSRHSIHSLESLKSEGSKAEQEDQEPEKPPIQISSHLEVAQKNSGDNNEYLNYLSSQQVQERTLNVPLHTQENISLFSPQNNGMLNEFGGQIGQNQIFSFEKQHIKSGLGNVEFSPNNLIKLDPAVKHSQHDNSREKNHERFNQNEKITKGRPECISQQPPTSSKLRLKIENISPRAAAHLSGSGSIMCVQQNSKSKDDLNNQQSAMGRSNKGSNGMKLNFLQKFSNFIQESITDRKHHNSNNRNANSGIDSVSAGQQRFSGGISGHKGTMRHDEYTHSNNNLMRLRDRSDMDGFDRYDRMSNEDELFYRNLSSNKVKVSNAQQSSNINQAPQINIQNQSQSAKAKNLRRIQASGNQPSLSMVKESMDSSKQMSGGSFETYFKGPVKLITSNNIVQESSNEYQWGTPAKNSFAKNINQERDGGDKTHPANDAITVNRRQPTQFLNNTGSANNLFIVQQQTSQSAMETPLPLLHQDTEEGHITNEINHLKSNSKPSVPLDNISMQLKRDSVDMKETILGQRRLSQFSQYQDQATLAASKQPNLNLNISLRLKLKQHNSPVANGNRLGQILSPFSRKEPIDAQISKQYIKQVVGDLQGNSKINFSSLDEQQILKSSLSHSVLPGNTEANKSNNINGLDLSYQERLEYNDIVNTRNQKLVATKNTQSHEQIASGENLRSSQYKLENTWVSRKPQDTNNFITTPSLQASQKQFNTQATNQGVKINIRSPKSKGGTIKRRI